MLIARVVMMICLLALTASASAAATEPMQVTNAWIRDAPPSAPMRAGYALLVNSSTAEIEIVSASSPAFGIVEMHETRVENDVARMVALPSIKIAAHQSFEFAPGGAHLMLMRPKGALQKGDRATITLMMKSGASVEAMFVVGAPPISGGAK